MTRKCSFKVHHTHSLNWTKVCFLDDFFLKFGIITNTFYCGSQNRVLEKVSLEVLMIDHVDNFVYWVKLIQGLSLDFSVLFPLLPWFDQKVLKQYLWFDQWINTWYTLCIWKLVVTVAMGILSITLNSWESIHKQFQYIMKIPCSQ